MKGMEPCSFAPRNILLERWQRGPPAQPPAPGAQRRRPAMKKATQPNRKQPAKSVKATPKKSARSSVPAGRQSVAASASTRKKTGGRTSIEACEWCWRKWSDPNPLKHSRGERQETLPRAKGYGRRCDICSAAWNWAYKGMDQAAHTKELSDHDDQHCQDHHAKWMLLVENFEDHRNGDPYRHPEARRDHVCARTLAPQLLIRPNSSFSARQEAVGCGGG